MGGKSREAEEVEASQEETGQVEASQRETMQKKNGRSGKLVNGKEACGTG